MESAISLKISFLLSRSGIIFNCSIDRYLSFYWRLNYQHLKVSVRAPLFGSDLQSIFERTVNLLHSCTDLACDIGPLCLITKHQTVYIDSFSFLSSRFL